MVTIHTINRLSSRIEDLEEQLGQTKRPTYVVWLSFDEQSSMSSFTNDMLTRAVAFTRRSP